MLRDAVTKLYNVFQTLASNFRTSNLVLCCCGIGASATFGWKVRSNLSDSDIGTTRSGCSSTGGLWLRYVGTEVGKLQHQSKKTTSLIIPMLLQKSLTMGKTLCTAERIVLTNTQSNVTIFFLPNIMAKWLKLQLAYSAVWDYLWLSVPVRKCCDTVIKRSWLDTCTFFPVHKSSYHDAAQPMHMKHCQ